MASYALFKDHWYCSEECELGEESDDGVLEYSKGLLWHGLNLIANRDAVREGDGPAMLKFWRLNMSQFWLFNHPKYLFLGHLLLVSKNFFNSTYTL